MKALNSCSLMFDHSVTSYTGRRRRRTTSASARHSPIFDEDDDDDNEVVEIDDNSDADEDDVDADPDYVMSEMMRKTRSRTSKQRLSGGSMDEGTGLAYTQVLRNQRYSKFHLSCSSYILAAWDFAWPIRWRPE
jgi:hypothetical protein